MQKCTYVARKRRAERLKVQKCTYAARKHRAEPLKVQAPTQPPTPPPTKGTAQRAHEESPYCHAHKAVLKRYERNGQVWYSHKTADGRWCRGK